MTITILRYVFNSFLNAIEGMKLYDYGCRFSGHAGRCSKTITQRNQTRSWSFLSSLRPVSNPEDRPKPAAEQLGLSLAFDAVSC